MPIPRQPNGIGEQKLARCDYGGDEVGVPLRCDECETGSFCERACMLVHKKAKDHDREDFDKCSAWDLIKTVPEGRSPRLPETYKEFFIDNCRTQTDVEALLNIYELLVKQFDIKAPQFRKWQMKGTIYYEIEKRFNQRSGLVPVELRVWFLNHRYIFVKKD